jgi:hypothetical protein
MTYQPTSRAAYLETLRSGRGSQVQERVYNIFEIRHRLTDEELVRAYNAMWPNTIRNTIAPARNALVEAGLLVKTVERRPSERGRACIVWGLA